jgi:hypothetical protein
MEQNKKELRDNFLEQLKNTNRQLADYATKNPVEYLRQANETVEITYRTKLVQLFEPLGSLKYKLAACVLIDANVYDDEIAEAYGELLLTSLLLLKLHKKNIRIYQNLSDEEALSIMASKMKLEFIL